VGQNRDIDSFMSPSPPKNKQTRLCAYRLTDLGDLGAVEQYREVQYLLIGRVIKRIA